ncbi:phage tail tape measure protein [Flavobacterium psychrophilum]|nr:phage tail tape measure protein [Flavobacterium psychrophilum]
MAQSKLELLMELKNKLFNSKLQETQEKLSKATDVMKGKLKGLKGAHIEAFSAMKNESSGFGRIMNLIGNPYVLITAGLLGVFTLFGNATSEAKKFNSEFLNIKQLNLDKNTSQLANYKELIRDSAFETGKSAVDSSKAFYDIQSALGYYGNDAKKVFTQVANYSTATGADMNEAVKATTKGLKAFGLSANDTKMLLESNAKAVQVGITTFKELSSVQTEYAGAASGAGQSVNTANKIFAMFTSVGKGSAEAATLAKTAFMGLSQEATVKGLKSIGVSLYDSKGNMRDLSKVLVDVDAKFKRMSPKQIDELINKIGGPEGLRALFVKLKTNASDLFSTFDAFDASKFDLDKALKNAQGDVGVLSEIVKNRYDTVMSKLGESVLPMVAGALDKINIGLQWLYANWDSIKTVLGYVGDALFVVGALLLGWQISAWASALATIGLSGALDLAVLGFEAVSFAISSIPLIGWILAGIALIIVLYKKVDWFRAGIDAMGAVLKSFFTNMWEGAKNVVGGIVDVFVGLKDIIAGVFTLDPDQVSKGVDDFKKGMKRTINGAIDVNPITNVINHGKEYGKTAVDAYGKSMKESADKAKAEKAKTDLLNPASAKTDKGTGKPLADAGKSVGAVTDKASQPRSIVINIDALNKGGINTSQTNLSRKSPEEIEGWFNEAMMRVVRGVETSYE